MCLLATRTGYLFNIKLPYVQDTWHCPNTHVSPVMFQGLKHWSIVLCMMTMMNDLIAVNVLEETELTTKSRQYNIKNRLKSQPHIWSMLFCSKATLLLLLSPADVFVDDMLFTLHQCFT